MNISPTHAYARQDSLVTSCSARDAIKQYILEQSEKASPFITIEDLKKNYQTEEVAEVLYEIIIEKNPLFHKNLPTLQLASASSSNTVFPYEWMLPFDQACEMLQILVRQDDHTAKEMLTRLAQENIPQSLGDAINTLADSSGLFSSYFIVKRIYNNVNQTTAQQDNVNWKILERLHDNFHPETLLLSLEWETVPFINPLPWAGIIAKFETSPPDLKNLIKFWRANPLPVKNAMERMVIKGHVSQKDLENIPGEIVNKIKEQVLQPLAELGCSHAQQLLGYPDPVIENEETKDACLFQNDEQLALNGDPTARNLLLKEIKNTCDFNRLQNILIQHQEECYGNTYKTPVFLLCFCAINMLENMDAIEQQVDAFYVLEDIATKKLWLAINAIERLAYNPNTNVRFHAIQILAKLALQYVSCELKLDTLAKKFPSCEDIKSHKDWVDLIMKQTQEQYKWDKNKNEFQNTQSYNELALQIAQDIPMPSKAL